MTEPTPKQLRYLRALTQRTETRFALPRTKREASDEIARLNRLLWAYHAHREPPSREHAPATETRPGGTEASVRRQIAACATRRGAERARQKRALVGRYELSGTTRAVYAERGGGGSLRLVDRPALGAGRAYLIDSDLQCDGADAIRALTADYLRSAQRLGRIPMAAGGGGPACESPSPTIAA